MGCGEGVFGRIMSVLGTKSFSCLAEVLKTCQNLIYYLSLNTFN